MFQDGSDRRPTDSLPIPSRSRLDAAAERPRSAGTDDSPRKSNGRPRRRHRDRPRKTGLPRSEGGPTPTGTVTPAANDGPPFPGACDRRRTDRSAPPAESAPTATRPRLRRAPRGCRTTPPPRGRKAESDGRTLRPSPFASRRFHVLLNSLFKVLFNFPSLYLFAIGLVSVFSLRWSLPPALGCILKQPDSEDLAGPPVRRRRGLTPALARPRSGGLGRRSDEHAPVPNTTVRDAGVACDSVLGCSRFTRRYWGNPG